MGSSRCGFGLLGKLDGCRLAKDEEEEEEVEGGREDVLDLMFRFRYTIFFKKSLGSLLGLVLRSGSLNGDTVERV